MSFDLHLGQLFNILFNYWFNHIKYKKVKQKSKVVSSHRKVYYIERQNI